MIPPAEPAPIVPAILLKNATLDYGAEEIVREVDLKVKAGVTKVILGPSGVGKSTILKAVLGLLRPKSGQVFIYGMEISDLSEKELIQMRLRMAMVFQGGALFDSMTVGENVSYRLREHGLLSSPEIEARVREVLQFVGLSEVLHSKPAQLSGGMKKRVAIARALAPRPTIFLFDEPTVGLDPINAFNVEQLILKLKKSHNSTMVIVTHDVGSAMRLADSVVMLHEGKFIFEGTFEELKRNPDSRIQDFLDPARHHFLE